MGICIAYQMQILEKPRTIRLGSIRAHKVMRLQAPGTREYCEQILVHYFRLNCRFGLGLIQDRLLLRGTRSEGILDSKSMQKE